ncbi:MAG: DUF4382 domain-containing protein [Terriglobales bacterium]
MGSVLAAAALLAGCGGNAGANVNASGGSTGGNASPTVVSVGDAPMSSVLAAMVTISAVSMTSSAGSVSLLQQPRTVELTHLGGIRAPLSLQPLPEGTYTSMSITVSAAQITYIDPNSGQPVMATATIPTASATQTITLNPALQVNDSGATDIRFDFDLQQSLDLSGSTVTFTPVIAGAVARVKDEDADARQIHVDGTVSATDTTKQTITMSVGDSGLTVTLNVTSSTQFDDGLSLGSLTAGTAVDSEDTIGPDGALTALEIETADDGGVEGHQGRVDGGIVTAVTRDSQNQLTSFTMVVRNCLRLINLGTVLTVQVNSATAFKDSMMAASAGLAGFDQSSIFPGQGVWVAGTAVQRSTNTVLAAELRPAAVNPLGLTSAAVTVNGSIGYSITLLLDTQANFAKFAGLTTLVVDTNTNTVLDGQELSSGTIASLAVGTPLVARGYLAAGASGSADVLYCAHLHEESH